MCKTFGLFVVVAAFVTAVVAPDASAADCKDYSNEALAVEQQYTQALGAGDYARLKALRAEKKKFAKWQDECAAEQGTNSRPDKSLKETAGNARHKDGEAAGAPKADAKKSPADGKSEGKGGKKGKESREELVKRIEDKYGVSIGGDGKGLVAGDDDVPEKIKNRVKDRSWSRRELELLEESMELLDPLLDGKKDALENMARVNTAIDKCTRNDKKEGVCSKVGDYYLDKGTMGVYYDDEETLVLTDSADDPVAFRSKSKEFKGTLIHEVAHGLTQIYDPRTGIKYDDPLKNPLFREWINTTGWSKDGTTLPKKGLTEKPPTDYAGESAREDLSESLMLYLLDKTNFKKKSPKRSKFLDSLFYRAECRKRPDCFAW
jgi:hypothetical protein